jgi:hypothetical protein
VAGAQGAGRLEWGGVLLLEQNDKYIEHKNISFY